MNFLPMLLIAGIMIPAGLPIDAVDAARSSQKCQPGQDCRPVCQTLEQKNCKPDPKKPKQPGNQPTFVPPNNSAPRRTRGSGTR